MRSATRDLVGGVGLIALTFLAYVPVFDAGFIWDDIQVYILENPLLTAPDGLRRIWLTRDAVDYYPFTLSTFWLEWRLWGDAAGGYHVFNVLLHAVSALLIWRILRRLHVPAPWLSAALFAVHPVNVESVAWISQRKNTLSAVFFFAAILSYLRFEASRLRAWLAVSLLSFALALLSKTSVVMLPLALLGLAWWQRGAISRRDVSNAVPFFVLALALGAVTVVFQERVTVGGHAYDGSFLSRFALAGRAIGFYVYKALVPLDLSLVYPRWRMAAGSPVAYVPLLLCLALAMTLWRFRRRMRAPLFAFAYFVLMLAPVLGFVDIGYMQFSYVADHWQYFSIISVIGGAVALAHAGLARLRWRRPLSLAAAAVVLVGCFALTWRQSRIYDNENTAWSDTIAKNPNAWNAHARLGSWAREHGDVPRATQHYLRAVELNPTYAQGHQVLGTLYAQMNMGPQATEHFKRALELQPDSAEAHANYGHYLAGRQRFDAAYAHLTRALALQPANAKTHSDLGFVLQSLGRLEEAAGHYMKALNVAQDADAAFNLGVIRSRQGRVAEAVAALETALRLRPTDIETRLTLAEQYAAQQQPQRAIALAQEALRLAQGADQRQLAARIQAQLQTYRTSVPPSQR